MNRNGSASSKTEILVEAIARQMGRDAVEKSKEQIAELIAWEKVRHEKQNESEVKALKVRYGCCFERRKELKELARLGPTGSLRNLCLRRLFNISLASFLVVAGVFFAHLTLTPFGLGGEAWLFSAGLGLVAAFWTERTLEKINSETLIRCVCILALIGSLGGLLVMALLRGEILGLYLRDSFADGTSQLSIIGNAADFYREAIPKLQLLMALLAMSMELGSGMAMFEARRLDLTTIEVAAGARAELEKLEGEMTAIISRVTHLENDPMVNEAQFYRDFYLGVLDCVKRNGLTHLLLITGLVFGLSFAQPLRAQGTEPASAAVATNVLIAIDLTQSVSQKGYDGQSDYKKNIDGACQLISQLPGGSRVTVLAITDHSFSQPYVLLQRQVSRDKGPLQFQDRIQISKAQIVTELRRMSVSYQPKYPRTDIFGALLVSADILREWSGRKILVVFSDMRQSTIELDIEHLQTVPLAQTLATVQKRRLLANLNGIEVSILGVDGAGKSIAYWNSLRDFWVGYFARSGAVLKNYSMLRDSIDLARFE